MIDSAEIQSNDNFSQQVHKLMNGFLPETKDTALVSAIDVATARFPSESFGSPTVRLWENKERQVLAKEMLAVMAYRQIAYLRDKGLLAAMSTTNDEEIGPQHAAEHIVAGLIKGSDSLRRSVLNQTVLSDLAKAYEEGRRMPLVRVYLSKCGDLLRGVFDRSHPNGDIAGNLVFEAQTLATLQLALEGDQSVLADMKSGKITVENTGGRSVVKRTAKALPLPIHSRTGEILRDNFWMITPVVSTLQANPALAGTVFGTISGQNAASAFSQRFEPYGIRYQDDGYLAPVGNLATTFTHDEKIFWKKVVDQSRALFPPKPQHSRAG